MALKPATKRIVISDESMNVHGFWTLTSGIDRSMYSNNPILLWNHNRPKTESAKKDDILPIGVMQNLTVDASGVLSGLPAFDDTDEFAMRIYEKYEAGIINMSSAGFEPIEILTDKESMKGKGPCLSKCMLAEISLTDIGSNRNAVKVYKNEVPVELSSVDDLVRLCFSPTNNNSQMALNLKSIAEILKLTDNATENDVLEAIKKQNAEILTLSTGKKAAEDALTALQKKMSDDRIVALVDSAEVAKKITAGEKDKYIKLASADYDTVKSLFDGMKPYESVETQLTSGAASAEHAVELAEILKLTNQQIYEQGKLDRLKVISLSHFKIKYREIFETEFKGK